MTWVAAVAHAGTQRIDVWGWRLSLGLAAVPAIVLTLGGALLPETPNSLIERGHHAEARSPDTPERVRSDEAPFAIYLVLQMLFSRLCKRPLAVSYL